MPVEIPIRVVHTLELVCPTVVYRGFHQSSDDAQRLHRQTIPNSWGAALSDGRMFVETMMYKTK